MNEEVRILERRERKEKGNGGYFKMKPN